MGSEVCSFPHRSNHPIYLHGYCTPRQVSKHIPIQPRATRSSVGGNVDVGGLALTNQALPRACCWRRPPTAMPRTNAGNGYHATERESLLPRRQSSWQAGRRRAGERGEFGATVRSCREKESWRFVDDVTASPTTAAIREMEKKKLANGDRGREGDGRLGERPRKGH